jgi:hypothetical protein
MTLDASESIKDSLQAPIWEFQLHLH